MKEEVKVKSNDKSWNETSTFERELVEPPSELDIKPVHKKEDPSSERKNFGEKAHA